MENELFLNDAVSYLPEITSLSSSPAIVDWVSMEENHPVGCYFWEKSTEQSIFDSALSSLVSSPTPSNSNFSGGGGDNFVIGKLGNIGEIYETPPVSNGNVSGSCYATPMNSPPPIKATPLAEFSGDPGFAERAAKFSSFNGRITSPCPIITETMTRVSSSSKIPAGESSSGENSRKRKAKSKEKSLSKASQSSKRSKKSEENEEKMKEIDPKKDFIHVRARRGQATDSHSLAERVRREKISEKMKLLQDLVPGCNKVTGKALMLDEIINYVQSLQRQVEFLSMKLSSVNTRLDFNMEALVSKDVIIPSSNNLMHHQLNSSSESNLLADHYKQILQLDPNFSDSISQYPTFYEDDLHRVIHMDQMQKLNQVRLNNFNGPSNQVPSHREAEF